MGEGPITGGTCSANMQNNYYHDFHGAKKKNLSLHQTPAELYSLFGSKRFGVATWIGFHLPGIHTDVAKVVKTTTPQAGDLRLTRRGGPPKNVAGRGPGACSSPIILGQSLPVISTSGTQTCWQSGCQHKNLTRAIIVFNT